MAFVLMLALLIDSLVVLGLARALARRRAALFEFLRRPEYRLESFDEVVWAVTYGRLPEAHAWVVLAVICLLLGGLGAVTAGLGLFATIRIAPQMVLPAMFCGYATWTGWRALVSQVGRVPVVQRLRLTQAHLVFDEVRLGLVFEPEEIEAAPPSGRVRTVEWARIRRVSVDDAGCIVVSVHGEADRVFGPLSDEAARDLLGRIERRRAMESGHAEVVDLDRVRLRALTERARRSKPPPGGESDP